VENRYNNNLFETTDSKIPAHVINNERINIINYPLNENLQNISPAITNIYSNSDTQINSPEISNLSSFENFEIDSSTLKNLSHNSNFIIDSPAMTTFNMAPNKFMFFDMENEMLSNLSIGDSAYDNLYNLQFLEKKNKIKPFLKKNNK